MTYTVSKGNQKKPANNKQPQGLNNVDFDDEGYEDEEEEDGESQGKNISPLKVDLIELVHESNSRAAELFFQYCQSEEDDEKQELFDQIKSGLKVHAQLVEELYYPLLPETAKEEDKEEAQELVFEAEASNYVASMILHVLETMKPSDDYFDGKMAVLHKLCREQVKREEKDMFEKLKAAETEIDLTEIGQAALERRIELEEEVASEGKRSRAKVKSASKSRAKGGSSARGRAKASSARSKKASARSSGKKAGAKARAGAKSKTATASKGSKAKAASSKSKPSKGKAGAKSKAGGKSKATGRGDNKSSKKSASKASSKKTASKRRK